MAKRPAQQLRELPVQVHLVVGVTELLLQAVQALAALSAVVLYLSTRSTLFVHPQISILRRFKRKAETVETAESLLLEIAVAVQHQAEQEAELLELYAKDFLVPHISIVSMYLEAPAVQAVLVQVPEQMLLAAKLDLVVKWSVGVNPQVRYVLSPISVLLEVTPLR